jgi:hypothetical protein
VQGHGNNDIDAHFTQTCLAVLRPEFAQQLGKVLAGGLFAAQDHFAQ